MFQFFTKVLVYGVLLTLNMNPESSYYALKIQTLENAPVKVDEKSLGIEVTAPYAIAVDTKSGKILFEKQKDRQSPIASITKLMTALVFLEKNPALSGTITVFGGDIKNGGQVILRAGDVVKVEDVFQTALISSSNEAAMALARATGLGEKEFVEEMNKKAKSFGLEYSFFIDPTGLEPANISTAHEIAELTKRAFEHSQIRETLQKKEYSFQVINTRRRVRALSTDKLLDSFINNPSEKFSIIGAKTGYIDESLYNFTIEVEKGGHSVILVLLGSKTPDDRWQEAKGLIEWVYANFQWKE